MTDSSTRWTGQTRLTNSQVATHVSQQEQSNHTSDPPFPVNAPPTDFHTGISKESPPILNSLLTYTSYTVPTPSIPSFWKRKLTSHTHNLVSPSAIVSTHQFHGNKRKLIWFLQGIKQGPPQWKFNVITTILPSTTEFRILQLIYSHYHSLGL